MDSVLVHCKSQCIQRPISSIFAFNSCPTLLCIIATSCSVPRAPVISAQSLTNWTCKIRLGPCPFYAWLATRMLSKFVPRRSELIMLFRCAGNKRELSSLPFSGPQRQPVAGSRRLIKRFNRDKVVEVGNAAFEKLMRSHLWLRFRKS